MDDTRIDRIEGAPGSLGGRSKPPPKADLADLPAEMYRLNGEMKGWMVATTLTMMATFLAALFGLQRLAS